MDTFDLLPETWCGFIPCAVCERVAREARREGSCVASAGDGVPQQADPGGDVHVHLASA